MNSIVPYEGTQPYVFLSYAHADAPAVIQIASHLQAAGCRIWYDGGIEVGSEWPEYIAAHLNGAAVMLAFLSNAYVRSDNCRKELHYAVSKGIRTINVFLEDAALTPGMALQIGNIFALMKYRMEEHDFYDRLYRALQTPAKSEPDAEAKEKAGKPAPEKRRKPIRPILRAVLGILLTAVVLSGICFIPAAVSATRTVSVSREEALAAAEARFRELVGEEAAQGFYVDYISRRLRHDGSLFKGVYIYNVEYQNQDGTEYKIEVNAASGKTVVRDID